MGLMYDCSGWATRNDLRCSDGRTIRKDAFKDNDGQTVPLVWQHKHDDPTNVLGHALLENREEGVYAYCTFNATDWGQHAKALVEHGDVTALSIYANQLKQHGSDVLHGAIREVSLVLAGANPGAFIDVPVLEHSDGRIEELTEEATIFTDETIELYHADEVEEEKESEAEEVKEDSTIEEVIEHAEEEKKEKTPAEVLETLTEEQKIVVGAVFQQLLEGKEDSEEEKENDEEVEHSSLEENDEEVEHSGLEGDNVMKHNVFDVQTASDAAYLSHSDEEKIIAAAKKSGSLKQAIEDYAEENALAHADGDPKAVSGFDSYPVTPGTGVEALFPEYRDVRPGAPELVTNDNGWVKAVLNKVHKSPYSRIRTSQVDVRGIEEIRARGYKKGKEKVLAGQYAVAKRATDPQTIYVKSALNRDDIVDITDFDYVDYQYKIDRMQLETELARAILIGDGRDDAAADKISPDHIRPIWTDAALYTIHKVLDLTGTPNGSNTGANFGASYLYAQAMEEALLDAKIDYRGTGAADMFCQQQFFNKMMLAKDMNGRRIYANKNELATALDVNNIYNVPEFANLTRTENGHTYKLLALIGNLADYAVGSTKGGEITHFNQFDIDFNQEKSLIETRVSGATTRIYSFIAIEEEVTENPSQG